MKDSQTGIQLLEKLTSFELKTSIMNAVKLYEYTSGNIEELLLTTFT